MSDELEQTPESVDQHPFISEDEFDNLTERDRVAVLYRMMKDIHRFSRRNLIIGREYKANVGDPLMGIINFVNAVRSLITWLIGGALTLWGLKEIIDYYINKRMR